ncbi:hypothetical protein P20495_3392 [Pseudoalteromonas sp. BSi20495]|nr:hypothetical protein P20495_3392 [Pseudoalteromonas sp. BSi20495]
MDWLNNKNTLVSIRNNIDYYSILIKKYNMSEFNFKTQLHNL